MSSPGAERERERGFTYARFVGACVRAFVNARARPRDQIVSAGRRSRIRDAFVMHPPFVNNASARGNSVDGEREQTRLTSARSETPPRGWGSY